MRSRRMQTRASPDTTSNGTLVRHANGVSYTYHTRNLDAGAAYTAWAVVFNHPEECAGFPCGLDDLGNADVAASVFWSAGKVIPDSTDGVADFSAYIPQGEPTVDTLFGPGLQNVEGAEVHVVLRTHGEPIPGLLWEQLNLYLGGCDTNFCVDQQAIAYIH